MIFLIVYGVALGGLVILALVAWMRMREFLRRTPALRSRKDLARFKRLAAWNMYGALVAIGVAVVLVLDLVVGFLMGTFGLWQMSLLFGLASVAMLLASLGTKRLEARVKTLPTADEGLRALRDEVVHVWDGRMLPDW